jgi:hypothetical protein
MLTCCQFNMLPGFRAQVLDDGSQSVGIQYGSKHGGGLSWAYWLRRRDDGLGNDAIGADIRVDGHEFFSLLSKQRIHY